MCSSQLALRVALRTMKDRCVLLQQKLSVLEEENEFLRSRLETNQHEGMHDVTLQIKTARNDNELENLRSQVSELNKQNIQLMEYIHTVSNENKKLWSRLSVITKKQEIEGFDNYHLIPWPTSNGHASNKYKLYEHSGEEEKDNILENCFIFDSENIQNTTCNNEEHNSDSLMNAYEKKHEIFNIDAPENDFNIEAKKCIQGLKEIRLEVMRQQLDVSSSISSLENRLISERSPICCHKARKADKCCNTDDIPGMTRYSLHQQHEVKNFYFSKDENSTLPNENNFIRRKQEADGKIKVCPMCGLSFGPAITFDLFCSHVESHFFEASVPKL